MNRNRLTFWLPCLLALIACCLPALAGAATITFDGGAVTGCTFSNSQNYYTCASSAFNAANDVSIGHGYTVSGNIVAKQLDLDNDAHTSGNVTAVNISLATHASMSGNITASGTISLQPNTDLSGNVTADTLTMQPNSTVTGTVTARVVDRKSNTDITSTVVCTQNEAPGCACQNVSGNVIACAPAFHHILVSHPGSGLTCTPTTVTVTACANAACSAPHYTAASVNVTLNPGGKTFATGTNGTNSAATVWQTTTPSGTISATSSPAAANATTCLNTSNNSASCTLAAADAGFLFDVANHDADTAQSVNISAVRKADNSLSCVSAFSGAKSVKFCANYVNPATGTLPVTIGTTAIPSCASGATTFSLSFNSAGVAPFTLQYPDVGQLSLTATYVPGTADANLVMTGQDSFIAAPKSFGISVPNLSASVVDASAAKFTTAGTAFSVNLTALNASGVATPNYGKETTPETVSLTATPVLPATSTAALGTPINGSFTNGVMTSSTSWGDVGIIKLTARVANANGYLGAGATASTDSANIGRFTPAWFNTEVVDDTTTVMACPTGLTCPSPLNKFVYSRQPFHLKISAMNAANNVTMNYEGSFAKAVKLTGWDAAGGAIPNPPAAAHGSVTNDSVAATSFVKGVVTASPSYAFPVAYPVLTGLAAPTNVYLRAVEDSTLSTDGTTSLRASATEGGVMVVGGRFNVGNNHGSELLQMPVVVTAQFWNGTRYVNSTTDDLNTFLVSDLTLSKCTNNIVCAAQSLSSVVITMKPGTGTRSFKLPAPGAVHDGSYELTVGQPAWLPSTTGRFTFGVNRSPLIYLREVY